MRKIVYLSLITLLSFQLTFAALRQKVWKRIILQDGIR